MDEAIGDEITELVDGTHTQHKDNEFTVKPGSSNMLQSNDMVTPGMDDYPYADLDAKDLDRIGSSGHASTSPRCVDGAGDRVEELTLRSYNGKKPIIVGASRSNQWQNLYQISSGSGTSNPHGHQGKGQAMPNDGDIDLFAGLLGQSQPLKNHSHDVITDNLPTNNEKDPSGEILLSSGGIRTKILSKSGFSEYFIKGTLRGKGVIHKSQASGSQAQEQDHSKPAIVSSTNFGAQPGLTTRTVSPLSDGFHNQCYPPTSGSTADGVSLRAWLEVGQKKASKVEKMGIFKRVLDLLDISHSQGVSLKEFRPSHFKLSGSYQVVYLGSFTHTGLLPVNVEARDIYQLNHNQDKKGPLHQSLLHSDNHTLKKRKFGENTNVIQSWPQFRSRSGLRSAPTNVSKVVNVSHRSPSDGVDKGLDPKAERNNQSKLFGHNVPESFELEEKWYTSPEQSSEKSCTFASNIYCLGVLLFELLGSFDSGRSHAAAMLDLRHRILPPSFLLENPREAGFCLWLLHPEPSLRPVTREILQSEFVSGIQESSGSELLPSIDEEDGESELLLYFLLLISEKKQNGASNLAEHIQRIEADIQEIEKRQPKISTTLPKTCGVSGEETRLVTNIGQLEEAYFSMGSSIQLSDSNHATRRDCELLKSRENWNTRGNKGKYDAEDHLGAFFHGLCKYARYRNFKVRGVLQNGEFNNSASVICSLSFDRDEEYLAAGGVSKKIKIFEFQELFNDCVDIHYPVIEMSNASKLSCICWNRYIRNYLASSDCDGMVKLWDAEAGQEFSRFVEHGERAWSVDFSRLDPMKLVSGSDDRLVKIWCINEKNSVHTIRNKANVCCVQFSDHSPHLLGFSSADYKTYCYDLRNVSSPWCILSGHHRAVSYAKFLDAETLVSASTDSTLKIWDLKRTSSESLSRDACILTLKGHTNEKNFVGLSVADGYITCGSETNEVFAYYKSLPMPITAHKFGSIDPMTGKETEDDNGHFVSSVCWRQKSNTVVAANSSGCIKLLQMV